MPASDMFRLSEAIRGEDYLLATYYIEMPAEADILAKAASYAVGQTIGTWVEVPGVTAEMRDRHLGRVVKVLEAPPVDLGTQAQETSGYFMQIALPTVNIGPSIPMLLATAIGNDVSTSVQAKLVDLEVPDTLAEELVGPRFGIEGVRKLVGVHDRPLVLNMIKPCTGLTPEAGAQIFYETALGGVDLIKDDELMGNPSFSPVVDRVKAYLAAGERARDETGRDVSTSRTSRTGRTGCSTPRAGRGRRCPGGHVRLRVGRLRGAAEPCPRWSGCRSSPTTRRRGPTSRARVRACRRRWRSGCSRGWRGATWRSRSRRTAAIRSGGCSTSR